MSLVTVASSVALTTIHAQPLTGLDQVVSMAARGVVVVAIFGVAGFCIGLLTGSTGATVGVLLGGDLPGLRPLRPRLQLVLGPAPVALEPGGEPECDPRRRQTTYAVSTSPGAGGDGSPGGFVERTVGLAQGLGYWAVLLAALVAVTWLVFRRRDVS